MAFGAYLYHSYLLTCIVLSPVLQASEQVLLFFRFLDQDSMLGEYLI